MVTAQENAMPLIPYPRCAATIAQATFSRPRPNVTSPGILTLRLAMNTG